MKKKIIISLLRAMACLPWWILYGLSDVISFLLYHAVRYRRDVVRKNLVESFPDKTPRQIKRIEKQYYRFMSDMIVETVKLLHISDREMASRARIKGVEIVNESLEAGRSAVIFLGHFGNWEWVQEISRTLSDHARKGSIYHPLNSKLWNDVYLRIRSRWGAWLLPQKEAVRALLKKENRPWVVGFIADHRPGSGDLHDRVDFLNHSTAFITGPEIIGRKVGADFFYLDVERKKRGRYEMTFKRLSPADDAPDYPYTRAFWREFERSIRRNPPYWLWSHKRWKFT